MSLKDALAGVKQGQTEHVEPIKTEGSEASLKGPKAVKSKPGKGRMYGKSSNPEFEKIGVYVRTETRRKAERKWEDQGGGDLSDLIESLLNKFSVS